MSIIDVARYFVYLSYEDGKGLTNLKLQKLLFYAQGFSFAWNNKELFVDEFEAWKYGPVNRRVYLMFKKYGQNPIPIDEGINVKFKSEQRLIRTVWSMFKDVSAYEMVELTHQSSVWLEAINHDRIISNDKTKNYFQKVYS